MGSPVYGTWIRPKKLVAFWILTLCLGSLSLLGLAWHPLFLTGLLALPFAYTAIVISMTALAFSEKGGDFQNKIHSLVIRSCALDTEVLDIGCGNGNMLINYAKTYPHGRYLGIDCWGDEWQYSKERCERNAKLEGIENIGFVQGSASSLPFPDASFSNVISCLTFHEVKDASDKLVSFKEALRVLNHDGSFAVFDLFEDAKYYGERSGILETLESLGAADIKYLPLRDVMRLGFPLNSPRSLRHAVLICGTKK